MLQQLAIFLLVCFSPRDQTHLATLAGSLYCTWTPTHASRNPSAPSLPTATIPLIHCICTDFSREYFHDPNFIFFSPTTGMQLIVFCVRKTQVQLIVSAQHPSQNAAAAAAAEWSFREPPPGLGSPSETRAAPSQSLWRRSNRPIRLQHCYLTHTVLMQTVFLFKLWEIFQGVDGRTMSVWRILAVANLPIKQLQFWLLSFWRHSS